MEKDEAAKKVVPVEKESATEKYLNKKTKGDDKEESKPAEEKK